MREIKFRAWVKSRSLMAFDVVDIYDDNLYVDGRYYCCFGDILDDDDIILEQFTGLRDKNGREIYEGDIYKCEDEDGPQIVEYYEGYEGDSHPVQGFIFCSFFREDNVISDIEVIGNIHETPELVATA